MIELLRDLGIGVIVLALLVGWLAAWRIGQVVSWRALVMTARATRSFTECVAFIRFCAEERDYATESRPRRPQKVPPRVMSTHAFDEWPRAF